VRKSTVFIVYLAVSLLLMLGMLIHGGRIRSDRKAELERKREFVERVGVTDLCIFTDARYARHPSMADLHTPFQDYPLSFEHFPSGSILSVPPHLRPRE
jgi:hypothetical protein